MAVYLSAAPTVRVNSIEPRNSTGKQTGDEELSHLHRSSSSVFSPCLHGTLCSCGRRRFLGSIGSTFLLPGFSFTASAALASPADLSTDMLMRFHPPRPNWYEEFYASAMVNSMRAYEAEAARYKSELFNVLKETANDILEIGIGTGPNLKYYANDAGKRIIGVDPNTMMEKYARKAAKDAGLPPMNFQFLQAVGEALPIDDDSVDAVIGTLVLCSVSDVNQSLREVKRVLKPGGLYLFVEHVAARDGTFLRFAQNIFDPLQQIVADGCHLTRDTGRSIAEAGFSQVRSQLIFMSNASFINPHVYGVARN